MANCGLFVGVYNGFILFAALCFEERNYLERLTNRWKAYLGDKQSTSNGALGLIYLNQK